MPITSTVNGNAVNITISGRFDFSCHKEFRDAYEQAVAAYQAMQFDKAL